jgi:hypothetical protein
MSRVESSRVVSSQVLKEDNRTKRQKSKVVFSSIPSVRKTEKAGLKRKSSLASSVSSWQNSNVCQLSISIVIHFLEQDHEIGRGILSHAETRAADALYDFRLKADNAVHDVMCDEKGRSMVMVIPSLLSPSECDELIGLAEEFGLRPNEKESFSFRTAKRTKDYVNEELSNMVRERLTQMPVFIEKLTGHDGMGDFDCLVPNWRMLRYDPGDKFPAHQDQMDTRYIKKGPMARRISRYPLIPF